MDATLIAVITLSTINLFLAGMVLFRNPRNPPNQAFVFFVITLVGWSVCVQRVYGSATPALEILWGRPAFAFASLIGSSIVVFCELFPDATGPRLSKTSRLFIVLGTLLAGLSLTPLVLRDMVITSTGQIQRHYGPVYPAFAAFFLTALAHGIWTLTKKWRTARGRSRQQIQYLWLGLCLLIGGGTTTNLVIPILLGSSHASVYGPYFSVFFVCLTAHAIIRHRLMDIRLIIRKSVTYGLSAGAAIGIIWGLLIVMDKGFEVRLQPAYPLLPLIMSVAGALVFHRVQTVFQYLLDRYCYRQEYDYQQAIRRISQVLASLLRIDPLCKHLTTFIIGILKVEEVAVYLCREHSLIEQCAYQYASDGQPSQIEPLRVVSPQLMGLFKRARQPVLQDELALWADASAQAYLHEEFLLLRSKIFIPLFFEQEVVGLIAVGEKRSGDPFFNRDVELLATIGHQAGAALKRSQLHEEINWMKEYNESILRHMESGLVVVSHDNLITVVNEAAARLLGLEASAIVGQPLDQLMACGLGLPLLDTLRQKAAYANHEVALVTALGQTLPVVLSTSILHGEDNQPSGAILAFNDLSQIKALEEEKRRIERLASIGAFMSGIAHEIKNPLVAIKTLAELLPEQYDDAEFRETFTKVTLNEVDRIDALVRRLRSLSTGSAVPLHPLNILDPLEETLSLISGELIRHHTKVIRDYQPPILPIMGDHDQLKQVFVNLCLNSVEAMREGGTLRVAVEAHDKPVGQPSELIIRIADTGPGIPAEHISTIFDPFFTLKEQGTGLGLAICRGIIDHHRGSIAAANSCEDAGAVFTVKLPVVQGVKGYESTVAGSQQARTTHPITEVAR